MWLLYVVLAVGLQWTAPSLNTDGTPITDPGGFRVCVSPQSFTDKAQANCDYNIDWTDVGTVIQNVLPGVCNNDCYIRVFAYDDQGNESALSNEVRVKILILESITDLMLIFLSN